MNSKDKPKESQKNKKYGNFLYDFTKVTGAIPALLYFRPKVLCPYGKDYKKHKSLLICANHIYMTDPVLLLCVFGSRRLTFLASTAVMGTKLKNFFFTRMHCIPVDKNNFSMASFHEVCDRLTQGKSVAIFPEGGLNTGDKNEMQALKSGMVLMAHKANAPLLPVYIVPARKWYKRQIAVVGKPIDVREICGDRPSMAAMNKVSDLIKEKEEELKEYYYGN